MVGRWVVKVATLSRGWMWYSECSANKLHVSQVMAKRFSDKEQAVVCVLRDLRGRSCEIVKI